MQTTNNILETILLKNDKIVKNILFGHLNNLLSESKQLIPFIREYYDIVWNMVSEITGIKDDNDIFPYNEKKYKILITEKDFTSVETFFNSLNLTIDLTITNEIGTYDYSGGYVSQSSIRDCLSGKIFSAVDGDKLPIVKINGTIKTSVTTIQEAIAALVYHEFTHAYEDLQRILKNKRENSITSYTVFSNYNGINAIKSCVPIYGEMLGNVVYLTKQIEMNAYVSQTIGEIEVKEKTIWANNLVNIIKGTKGYQNYAMLLYLVDVLGNVQNTQTQNDLLVAYNTNAGIIGRYNGKNKRYKFKNYSQMIRWFRKKAVYCYETFIEKLTRHFEDEQIRNKYSVR